MSNIFSQQQLQSLYQQQSYSAATEQTHESTQPQPHPVQRNGVPSLEEAAAETEDTSSRPRLTPEQIAVLEDNFKVKPKPGTDFKKQLAAKIGLSLQRVNNWYQNRRAKARHQRPQERRFAVLPTEQPSGHWPSLEFAQPKFEPFLMDHSAEASPQPLHEPSNDYISIPRSDEMEDKGLSTEMDLFHELIEPSKEFAPAEHSISTSLSLDNIDTSSLLPNWSLQEWSPDSLHDSAFQDENFATFEAQNTYSHPMYQNTVEGLHIGNPSCQTFATTSSSEGEPPSLMTPPPRTSPLPFLPQDAFGRRGSVTADISSNLHTIHLQQSKSSLNGYNELLESQPVAPSQSPNGTPPAPSKLNIGASGDIASPSLRTAHNESNVPRLDLASRRKRPRPAALRPDAHRSQSYAGPLTMSPTTRVPSSGLATSNSVRRIKSTGNGLNVMTGRIQKSSLSPAQMSPRNLHSFPSVHLLPSQNGSVTESAEPAAMPLTPLSPEAADHPDPVWPQPWTTEQDHTTLTGLEAEALITSPPITPYDGAISQPYPNSQLHGTYHWPPQSAPPQQTSFFNDSPSMEAPANFAHLSWQVPSSISLHGCSDDNIVPSMRPSLFPQYGYQDAQPFPGHHPPQVLSHPMGLCHPHAFEAPSQPQKEFEIQVQVIPAPEGLPQGRKTYTFNHTTPKDFSSQDGTSSKVVGTSDVGLA
ncbi:MAG: hypothetical protein LQ351_002980 [Letrouitia transgressa]|nr:MAG: hypothetical protein LQ351_002980 [Letrouitia transgressa]